MRKIIISIISLLFLPAMARTTTIKLQRPSDLKQISRSAVTKVSYDIGASDTWFYKHNLVNVPLEEVNFDEVNKQYRLKFNTEGKLESKKLLHFGDDKQILDYSSIYSVLDKETLCSLSSYKKFTKAVCEDKSIDDNKLLIIESGIEESNDFLKPAFLETKKEFFALQDKHKDWEVVDANDTAVVLRAENEEGTDWSLFYVSQEGFEEFELPFAFDIYMGKNCLNFKYKASEIENISEINLVNLEDDRFALCSRNLVRNISRGEVYLARKDQLIRYDLKLKTNKVYDLSFFIKDRAKGMGFINSLKDFGNNFSVVNLIYQNKDGFLTEENFLVKDAKVPSLTEMGSRPMHFFDKDNYLACSYETIDEGPELLLIDKRNKKSKKVFNTETTFWGARLKDDMSNKFNDSQYGCSYLASIIPGSGGVVLLADQYYTQKPKYSMNEGIDINLKYIKAINMFKVDYKDFCGLSPLNKRPLRFPHMNVKANYQKYCDEKDGILLKSKTPVYDKPKELFAE